MIDQTLVSVIIPCYNDGQTIERCIQSIKRQTYSNIEIVVIDDGSNSSTKNALKGLEDQIDVHIEQSNKGQASARNLGIKKSSGELILTLDADDTFQETFVEKAVAVILEDKTIQMVTCHARVITKHSSRIFKPCGGTLDDFLFQNAALGNLLFRKSTWAHVNGYDEKMTLGWEDWEFNIRLLKSGGQCKVIPEVLFNYHRLGESTTTIANCNRNKLTRYIFVKHRHLYENIFPSTLDFFLKKIDDLEYKKIQTLNSVDYRLGNLLLKPVRLIKNLIK
jgi:glycosyltransferase involved in cell wall biosynthesis